jgi:hypothetical protein
MIAATGTQIRNRSAASSRSGVAVDRAHDRRLASAAASSSVPG